MNAKLLEISPCPMSKVSMPVCFAAYRMLCTIRPNPSYTFSLNPYSASSVYFNRPCAS